MKAAVKEDVRNPAYSKDEVEEAALRLEELRGKLQAAQRRACGLPQATKEQREKVRELKAANKQAPGSYSSEEIATEIGKLRAFMCKYSSKRKLALPAASPRKGKTRAHEGRGQGEEGSGMFSGDGAGAVVRKRRCVQRKAASWREGLRRCNCVQGGQVRCVCACGVGATYGWPCAIPSLAQIAG